MANEKEQIPLWIIFFIVVLFLYGVFLANNSNSSKSEDIIDEPKKVSEFYSLPSLDQGWERYLDIETELDSKQAYTYYGLEYGFVKKVRYYLKSEFPLEVYWTKSKADCMVAFNGGEFEYYSSLSPNIKVYEYSSQEIKVVSDSALCVINRNLEKSIIRIVIDQTLE